MIDCLNCSIIISNYLGIKSVQPTDGWFEVVIDPVQLCLTCANAYFDKNEIVNWSDDE